MINTVFRKIKTSNHIDFFVISLFFIGIFSFLFFTGTINSGYHFTDDHEMVSIKLDLEKGSFINTSIDYIKNDLNIRFRPLYYLHRVSEIKTFGIHFFILSLYTWLLASLTFSSIYFGARKLRHSIPEALLLVLLTFVGSQMAIWWRLGPNETVGMFFFGLSFLFMGMCTEKRKYLLNSILFSVFLILTSLCKESFVIIIPAFVLFKIWNEKNTFNISIKESVKNNYLLVLPMIAMFIELLVIKFMVGTNKLGYAGMVSSLGEFLTGIKNILFNRASLLPWFIFIGGLFFLYLVSFKFLKEKKKTTFPQSLKSFSVYFCFSLLIILPNIFMYAKSGMWERYLLPTTFGLSFLVVGILQNTKQIFFKVVMFLAIFVFLFHFFNTMKNNAFNFANEGKQTNILLSTIKNNTELNSKILLVADPANSYEASWSIKTYLSFHSLNDFYAYPMTREYKTDFEKVLVNNWEEWFKNKELEDMGSQPDLIIIMDKNQAEDFFNKSNVEKIEYKSLITEESPYSVYLK